MTLARNITIDHGHHVTNSANQTTHQTKEPNTKKSVVLSNHRHISNILAQEIVPPIQYTAISIEQISIHSIYKGAPNEEDATVTISLSKPFAGSRGDLRSEARIPFGDFTNDQFATTFENNINGSTYENIDAHFPKSWAPPAVWLHQQGAPDINDTVIANRTEFIKSTQSGNQIPMKEILQLAHKLKHTDRHILAIQNLEPGSTQCLPDGGFAVTRIESEDPVSSKQTDKPCITVTGQCNELEEETISEWHNSSSFLLDPNIVSAMDPTCIPATSQGDFEFLYKYGQYDPIPTNHERVPIGVLLALVKCWNAHHPYIYLTIYIVRDQVYARVTGFNSQWLNKSTIITPDGSWVRCLTSVFRYGATDSQYIEGTPSRMVTPESLLPNPFVFRVLTGSKIATVIESVDLETRLCPRFGLNGEKTSIYRPHVFYDSVLKSERSEHITYLLPETIALAGAFCKKYNLTFKDKSEHYRLITQIQESPLRYGLMCSDVLICLLVRPRNTTPVVAFQTFYSVRNAIPSFTLSGKGCRVLGIDSNTTSIDLGEELYKDTILEATGLVGSCGFQTMYGFPTGMTLDGSDLVSPQRILGFLYVNHIRVPGRFAGSHHAIDIPSSKAVKDVYEPKHHTGVVESQPKLMTSIGISFESRQGSPVFGEYTVVMRIE